MNTNREIRLTRRRFQAGFLAGFLALPVAATAHDGHGASRISAEAQVVRVNGRVISLRIALLNLGSTPVQLLGVGAENAADVVMPEPVVIDVYDEAVALVDLHFAQDIPGVFTAYLDFGEHGRGPVLVMP